MFIICVLYFNKCLKTWILVAQLPSLTAVVAQFSDKKDQLEKTSGCDANNMGHVLAIRYFTDHSLYMV